MAGKFDQKEKYAEILGKVKSFCGSNKNYAIATEDPVGFSLTIVEQGKSEPIDIKVEEKRVTSTNQAFVEKVMSFVTDNTDERGNVSLPAVIDDDERKEISSIFNELSEAAMFKQLKLETVMKKMCPGATPQEFLAFLMDAKMLGVNPFIPGHFYFIKNKNGDVYHHVGVAHFRSIAKENPDYIKHDVGVIVLPKKDGADLIRRQGEFYSDKTEELVGAWCKVYLKSRSKDDPIVSEVMLSEYVKNNQTTGPWSTKKATMICKVAEAHGLRQSTAKLNSLYLADELGVDPAKEVKILPSDVVEVEGGVVAETI
jgi:hypothetical protein